MINNKKSRISFLSGMMKNVLVVASAFLFLTCGNNDTSLTDTGSAVFSITWPESVQDSGRASQALNNPSIDCDALSVATVEVDVNDGNQQLLVEASFPCSQGAGTVDEIPVGTDREFIVTAKTAAGGTVYQGSVSGIAIQANVISDCGAIELNMVDADGDEVPDVLDSCPQSPALDVVGLDGCSVLRFTDMGDGTVKDNASGLIWLKNANAFGQMAWEDARSAVANLSDGENGLSDGSVDGDWRLPTLEEWEAFIDTDYSDPALCDAQGNTQWTEGDAFAGVQSWFHWSSTEGDSCAWRIGLTYGGTACNGKSDELYVWPVREDVPADSDGDSILDYQDTCPNTPAGETVDQNGCSDSQKDSDGDGVKDDQDNCPDTATGLVVDANGCTEVFTNSLGMNFVHISAGIFQMGSATDELGRDSDETQHQVTLSSSFYLQTKEVTQSQWEEIMGGNPSSNVGCSSCPVEMVSWNTVQTFICRLNDKGEGTYCLPTEAQWEYAARARSTTPFSNGDITFYDDMSTCNFDDNLDVIGWYCDNSGNQTNEVAQKIANAWGLYDMHGNVSEWCQDYYGSILPVDVTDPEGASSSSTRVCRGGNWSSQARKCRSANRNNGSPSQSFDYIGFRLIYSP